MKANEGPKSPELSVDEEAKIIARVPENFLLTDGVTRLRMRRLKFKELFENSEVLVEVLRDLSTGKDVDRNDPKQRMEFLTLMAKAVGRPFLKVLSLITTYEVSGDPVTVEDLEEMDADDGVLVSVKFIVLHRGLKQAFFDLVDMLGARKKKSEVTTRLPVSSTPSSAKDTQPST